MATYITQKDVNELLYFAVLSAAQKLGVPEIYWNQINKLYAEIHTRNPTLGAALDAFIKAYNEWFEFIECIEEGKSGNKSPSESGQYVQLISARDNTRTDFIDALNSIA